MTIPVMKCDDTERDERPANPLVSVIIPTYNREVLLRQAVASVFAQTHADWELIVVDDGSTDDTRPYLASLGDARVHVLALDHHGSIARARNAGVAASRGAWIAFLDSDDLWLPRKLELQLQRLASCPSCGWSCTGFDFVDVAGTPVPQRSGEPYQAQSGWIRERLLTFTATATIASLLVDRSVLRGVGGFDEAFPNRDDYDLVLRLAAQSEICALPETLVTIREHEGRTTSAERVVALLLENDRVFRKAAAASTTAFTRAICRRQRAVQFGSIARIHSQKGEHIAAAANALRAIGISPVSLTGWRSAGAVALRFSSVPFN